MEHLKLSSLISADEIHNRVKKMGEEIANKYRGQDLVVLGVLKGSFMFYADLVRAIDMDLACDFCSVSSYANGVQSSGEARLTMDVSRPVHNRNLVIVEDIVDTGLTMNFLRRHFEGHKPKTITTVSLLLKPDALKEKCPIDLVGFKIPNDFVVGYGLDYQGYFRNLPYIAQVSNIN